MNKNQQAPEYWIHDKCTGPNVHCRRAHKQGRSVHIIPNNSKYPETLVLSTYHYETRDDAIAAFVHALSTAQTIHTDEELYAAIDAGESYLLQPGWVHPDHRSRQDWAKYASGHFLD